MSLDDPVGAEADPGSLHGIESLPPGTPSFAHVTASSLLVTISGVLPVFLTGGLSVQIRQEIEMSSSGYGLAVASFFGISALFSVRMGRLADKIGARAGQLFACSVAALSLGLTAMWAHSPITFAVSLAVGGLGYSISQGSTNLSIAQMVSKERRGFAFGIKQAGIPAGTLLGGLAVPFIGLSIGWRWAFAIAAAMALSTIMTVPRVSKRLLSNVQVYRLSAARTRPLIMLAIALGFGAAAGNALGAFFVSSAALTGLAATSAGF